MTLDPDQRRIDHHQMMTDANRKRLASFRENNRHIVGVRWLATFDGHCCIACAALDGAEWGLDGVPIGDHGFAFQSPPLHQNCRCVLSPVPKKLDDVLGIPGIDAKLDATRTRASNDGPTKARTYEVFLKQQPQTFIRDFLGEARAAPFMEGKLALRDFVDDRARLLPIDSIKTD